MIKEIQFSFIPYYTVGLWDIACKASVTILADFGPEFNPPFRWRSKHQTKITVHITNLVYSEFPNRSC